MGKDEKWSPAHPKHYANKTLAELYRALKATEEFVQKHPQFEFGWHNEYRQELRRRIAEMIGRKK